jgi:hypothetical protein
VRSHPGSKSRNLFEIDKAVFRSCRDIIQAYPDFHRQHAALITRRMERLRQPLFEDMITRGLYGDAREFARTVPERIIAFLRLPGAYEAYGIWKRIRRKLTGRRS